PHAYHLRPPAAQILQSGGCGHRQSHPRRALPAANGAMAGLYRDIVSPGSIQTMTMRDETAVQASMKDITPPPFRHKTVAALLSFLLGWAGAHWWYLGRPRAWLPLAFTVLILGVALLRPAPIFSQLWYYLILIPLVAGFVEALVLSLISDARFDARYNPGHTRQSRNGWGAVLIAIATLFIGMSIVMGHVVVASLEMAADTLRF